MPSIQKKREPSPLTPWGKIRVRYISVRHSEERLAELIKILAEGLEGHKEKI